MDRKQISFSIPWPRKQSWPLLIQGIRTWLPSRGNVIFTSLAIVSLVWATKAGAVSLSGPATSGTSTSTIAYQGRLADANGQPLTDTIPMIFRLYGAANGGVPLWEEQWTGPNSVQVSDGLFNVMLGSIASIPQNVITGNSSLWLGITVGTDDEMTPRVQLGSVPFAVQALTVSDGSVTTAKLADGAVGTTNLADGAVTSAKLDNDLTLPGTFQAGLIWSNEFQNIDTGGKMKFRVDSNVGGWKDALTIDNDTGFVGIGTNTPGSALQVNGAITSGGISATGISTTGNILADNLIKVGTPYNGQTQYLQIDMDNPVSTDCDNQVEWGRMILRDMTGGVYRLYLCTPNGFQNIQLQ